jgi:hypothetical protein
MKFMNFIVLCNTLGAMATTETPVQVDFGFKARFTVDKVISVQVFSGFFNFSCQTFGSSLMTIVPPK